MKIIKNIEEPIIKFGDLKIGDVFLDQEENVCMKVPMVYNDFLGAEVENLIEGCMDADNFYQHEANSYDFEHNQFFWLYEYEEVRPLKAHMEVK